MSLDASHLGMCVPSSCSKDEIETMILGNISSTSSDGDFSYNYFFIENCQDQNTPDMTTGDKIVMYVIITIY